MGLGIHGSPGTNPPWVSKDDYPSGVSSFLSSSRCWGRQCDLVKNTDVFALSETGGPWGQVSDVPRGLSGGLEVVNLFIMKEDLDDGHDQDSPLLTHIPLQDSPSSLFLSSDHSASCLPFSPKPISRRLSSPPLLWTCSEAICQGRWSSQSSAYSVGQRHLTPSWIILLWAFLSSSLPTLTSPSFHPLLGVFISWLLSVKAPGARAPTSSVYTHSMISLSPVPLNTVNWGLPSLYSQSEPLP